MADLTAPEPKLDGTGEVRARLPIGAVLQGKYRLDRLLGAGAMGSCSPRRICEMPIASQSRFFTPSSKKTARFGRAFCDRDIARLIVEAHRGRIDVSSEVGKGSTSRVTLPSHAATS
jgi:hypothetical protein